MKKSVIFFIIILVLIIIFAGLLVNENLIKNNKEHYEGELAESKKVSLTVPPLPFITIFSPENITYSTTTILLDYSTERADTIWYNLDNSKNITITSPVYFDATEGSHTLYLYANNSYGTTLKNVSFSIEKIQEPEKEEESGGSFCESLWNCTAWSECINFTQSRSCTDVRHCRRPYLKNETKECTIEKPLEPPQETGLKKISLFYPTLIIIIFLLLILLAIMLKNKKKKN